MIDYDLAAEYLLSGEDKTAIDGITIGECTDSLISALRRKSGDAIPNILRWNGGNKFGRPYGVRITRDFGRSHARLVWTGSGGYGEYSSTIGRYDVKDIAEFDITVTYDDDILIDPASFEMLFH